MTTTVTSIAGAVQLDAQATRKVSTQSGLLPEDSVQLGTGAVVVTSYSSLVRKMPVEALSSEITSSDPSCSASVFVDRDASQPTSLESSSQDGITTLVDSITKEL